MGLFEQSPIEKKEKTNEQGLKPGDLSAALEKSGAIYVNYSEDGENKVGMIDRTYYSGGDETRVYLCDEYGASQSFTYLKLGQLKMTEKPQFFNREYKSIPESEKSDLPRKKPLEKFIYHTSSGKIGGKLVESRPGGPHVIETPEGKIQVNKLL